MGIKNKITIVDDGIATGFTTLAAIEALRQHQSQEIVIATPVASRQGIKELKTAIDNVICFHIPESFSAVGFCYEDFSQICDREVGDLLSQKTVRFRASS